MRSANTGSAVANGQSADNAAAAATQSARLTALEQHQVGMHIVGIAAVYPRQLVQHLGGIHYLII